MTTQRDLLAALIREFAYKDDYDWSMPAHKSPDHAQRMADALLARGVRVVDADTLAEAHHRAECEPVPSHDEPDEFDKKIGNAMMRRLLVS